MDYLPLTSVIMDYLSQQEDPALFVASVRLVGNIITSPSVSYVENFFKNGLLESLTIGWQRFGALENVDLAKEITWILSNIVASHSVTMTQAIIDNRYVSEKLREMLSLDLNLDFKTRREVLILLKNMVAGYNIDICYRLVYQSNLLAQLIPLMTLDESHVQHPTIYFEALEIVRYLLEKETALGSREFYLHLEKLGGVDAIEQL